LDPTEAGSLAGNIVEEIRSRKGLKAECPPLDNFMDKL